MNTIQLIHWHQQGAEDLAKPLRQASWQVDVESEDGGRAYQNAVKHPPEAIVICLSRRPFHGRQTALSVRQSTPLEALSVSFVDGPSGDVDLIKEQMPEEHFVLQKDLVPALNQLRGLEQP